MNQNDVPKEASLFVVQNGVSVCGQGMVNLLSILSHADSRQRKSIDNSQVSVVPVRLIDIRGWHINL